MRLKRYPAILSSVISFLLATAFSSGRQADNENDTFTNPVIGICNIDKTAGWQSYQTFSCLVMKINGTQTDT